MRRIFTLLAILSLLGLSAVRVHAESVELLDGTSLAGDIVHPAMADGLNLHLYSGKYQKIPWDNLTPTTLERLAKDPALAPYVNPLLQRPEKAAAARTEIAIHEPERLLPVGKGSLIHALFHSPVTLVALLLIYAAGIYAGYEISVVRAFPPLLVCGVSALAPLVGPIFFLCLPTNMVSPEEEAANAPPVKESAHADASWVSKFQVNPEEKPGHPSEERAERRSGPEEMPETQVFPKGQFMFNRRFFETKFPGFFSLVRKDADKHMIICIRSARGEFAGHRISRITANELCLDGSTSPIQFIEIMEVQLKHENA